MQIASCRAKVGVVRSAVSWVLAAVALWAAVVASGCGDDDDSGDSEDTDGSDGDSQSATDAEPEAGSREQDLVIAVPSMANETLDPIRVGGTIEGKLYLTLLYDHLIDLDESGTELDEENSIASGWSESPDGLTWTFEIRDGVAFHDGSPLTAEDAAFSLQRALSEESESPFKDALAATITNVEANGASTLVLSLSRRSFSLPYDLSRLGGVDGIIIPRTYFEEVGAEEFARNPIGSGPYRFDSQTVGESLRLEAFEDYWQGSPTYPSVTFQIVPEESSRVAQLERGDVNVIAASRDTVRAAPEGSLLHEKENSTQLALRFHQVNFSDANPLNDSDVRRALGLAINTDEVVNELLGGLGQTTGSFFLNDAAIGFEEVEPLPYDPEEAERLLEEAGHPGGDGLSINIYVYVRSEVPEVTQVAQLVADYWRRIGVASEIIPIDFAAFLEQWRAGSLEDPAVSFHPHDNRQLPHAGIAGILRSDSATTIIRSPEIDRLVDEYVSAVSEEEYAAITGEIQDALAEELLGLPIAMLGSLWLADESIPEWNLGRSPFEPNLRALVLQ